MAYGFEFSRIDWKIILDRTHTGEYWWSEILQLNWQDISQLPWNEVDAILNSIQQRKEMVTLLLWTWKSVNFWYNTVPDNVWMFDNTPGNLPEWESGKPGVIASEDGKSILSTPVKTWTQGLKSAFPY